MDRIKTDTLVEQSLPILCLQNKSFKVSRFQKVKKLVKAFENSRSQKILYQKIIDWISFYNTMKTFSPILILLFLSSCHSQKRLFGIYKSKTADLGFFITKVELKNNNEFSYDFSGDLQHTQLSGVFQLKDHNLYLKFNKNKGEIESQNDSLTISEILSGNYHNYDLKIENGIKYHLKYKIRANKLFIYRNDNNKLSKIPLYKVSQF
ncbi:hypothetical protein [Chryseobacterium jejuense]|uniref:Uncharacterized protein n=1 Tax=Chryseobacterium jejuense TaxID=445960 RepID=A0A2X2X645_CHRJE|nr:hypothetical protein [Chryseobacterium jejuense]SDJ57423.1 hypothetical protein SAMN05421542_3855 [Chryseobacterium jejuense]SQB46151.1 Uncharacterised protein [Chryseobacterium jejuense]